MINLQMISYEVRDHVRRREDLTAFRLDVSGRLFKTPGLYHDCTCVVEIRKQTWVKGSTLGPSG